MSFAALLVRDVTILHSTTTIDEYGDPVHTWAGTAVTPGWLSQLTALEQRNSSAEVTTWHLSLPAGTAIEAQDRVTVDGIVYELTGPPNRAWTPRGEHHTECELRLVEG